MIGLGVASLWVALAAAIGTVGVGPRFARVFPITMAATLACSTVLLGHALWTLDFRLVYVADHARQGASGPYRVAGLWGGASGSLLLFAAMLAILLAALVRNGGAVAVGAARWGGSTVALLVASVLWLANPFARLAVPAIDGGGLQPILEHPAMLYHPLILYAGLVSTVMPFLVVTSPGGLPDGWRRLARRWLGASLAILTAGLATGANWAYVELGWGGYWGWDPVENGVLVPWLLVIAALHALGQPGRQRWVAALCASPWVMVLVGTAITRAGIGGSVHAFADDERLGWILLVLIGATLAVAATHLARASVQRRRVRRLLAVHVTLVGVAAFIVAVGVLYPIPAPGEPLVSGHFYAALLGPLAVIGLATAAAALGSFPARRGIGAAVISAAFALLVGARSPFSVGIALAVGVLVVGLAAGLVGVGARSSWATRAGHLGLAVLLIGVAGSTEGQRLTATLDPGEELQVGSQVVRHVGVEVVEGANGTTSSVRATIELLDDDRVLTTLHPELIAFPERSVLLAETALRSTPRRDVQVVLRSATDAGSARYDIAVVPLAWWVWWGAAGIVVAGVLVVGQKLGSPSRQREPVTSGV